MFKTALKTFVGDLLICRIIFEFIIIFLVKSAIKCSRVFTVIPLFCIAHPFFFFFFFFFFALRILT